MTIIAGESLENIGPQSLVTMTSGQSTGNGSLEWTLSAGDSHASPSVVPGSDEARQMTVTSGRKWSAVSPYSDPLGSLVKMCLGSSIWGSTKCSLTWKPLVIKQRCLGFRLVVSMRRTLGNGSGLWPTPRAEEKSQHNSQDNGIALSRAVKMWPTPKAQNAQAPCLHGQGGMGLQEAVGGQLNPPFVEWLMGFPIGWTDLGD